MRGRPVRRPARRHDARHEREDRRLAPFTPGSRKSAAAGEWLLQVPSEPTGYTMIRRDWVSVATNWQPLPSAESPRAVPSNQAPAVLKQREQPRSPAERLTTLEELKNKYDFILIDSLPAITSPDSIAISRYTDGVVLVVEAERTRRQVVENVKNKIARNGGNIIGIVFNKRKFYIPQSVYRRLF